MIIPPATQQQTTEIIQKVIDSMNRNCRMKEIPAILCYPLKILTPLSPIISQICNCLLIDAHIPVITTTNFLLERTLKLALIINAGNGKTYSGDGKIENTFKKETRTYDNLDLSKTIEIARERKLITPEKEVELNKYRNNFRNAFSHAEYTKVFKNAEIQATIGNLGSPHVTKIEMVNIASTPLFQGPAIRAFCKKNAFPYFSSVFELICMLDKDLYHLYRKK